MPLSKVSVRRALRYDTAELKTAMEAALSDIGFDPARLSGRRVALKPNLLMPVNPDKAVVTHPAFFRAAAELVTDAGGRPVLVESPNFFDTEKTARKVGYGPALDDLGIEVADVGPVKALSYPKGRLYQSLEVSAAFFEADVILGLPKLKMHAFTTMTGAVKNLFGTIPGTRKSRMHMRLPDRNRFAEFLLDLYGALVTGFDPPRPVVHLMDGVTALEGDGPGPAGRPRHVGAVLASECAVSLDHVVTRITGLDPSKVPTLARGFGREFAPATAEDITLCGDPVKDFVVPDFAAPKNVLFGGVFWPLTSATFKNFFVERPVPRAERCTLCYQCLRTCPAEAIRPATGRKNTPDYDYRKCIRCFCCLEVCPEAAVELVPGRFQWLLPST